MIRTWGMAKSYSQRRFLVPAFTCWQEKREDLGLWPTASSSPASGTHKGRQLLYFSTILLLRSTQRYRTAHFTWSGFLHKHPLLSIQRGDTPRYQSSPFHFAVSSSNIRKCDHCVMALAWRDRPSHQSCFQQQTQLPPEPWQQECRAPIPAATRGQCCNQTQQNTPFFLRAKCLQVSRWWLTEGVYFIFSRSQAAMLRNHKHSQSRQPGRRESPTSDSSQRSTLDPSWLRIPGWFISSSVLKTLLNCSCIFTVCGNIQ